MAKRVSNPPSFRKLTILAQDPALRRKGRIVTAQIQVPAEVLAPGPRGYRVHVIDADASNGTLYEQLKLGDEDPYAKVRSDKQLLSDPRFHAQNVYAIVMATLGRFEFALGRRVPWGFAGRGHQLKVVPHAFAEANAFYVRADEALLFGYFPAETKSEGMVFSCLSHDIVAHETTHALLDGMRPRFSEPSSPDQEGFHEGFADAVAILSVFRLEEIVEFALAPKTGENRHWLPTSALTPEKLRKSVLFTIADEMGQELSGVRGEPLRASANLKPSRTYLSDPDYQECHERGEVFVAAVLEAFLRLWLKRLETLTEPGSKLVNRKRAVEEGASVADHLLTILIRALDYTPPVDLQFPDFLTAMLTADQEVYPDDTRYHYRETLFRAFGAYGIDPATPYTGDRPGQWFPPKEQPSFAQSRFESMQRDREEMFRFVWQNRELLELDRDAYTSVTSVRPSYRQGEEGFPIRETVAEYVQILDVEARDLKGLGVKVPAGMLPTQKVRLNGGGALIFDEYGRLKFHIDSPIKSKKQNERLRYLLESGEFDDRRDPGLRFAQLHRRRAMAGARTLTRRR